MITSTLVYLIFFIRVSYELNNGLGKTPQMGKTRKVYASVFMIDSFKDGIVGIILNVILVKK
jgi:hypothetical protein